MVFYVVLASLAVVGAWALTGRHRPSAVDGPMTTVLASARRRSLTAIGVAVVIVLVGVFSASFAPQWLGVGAALAPSVAGAAGLLLYAAMPPRAPAGTTAHRSASLRRRTAWNVAPTRSLVTLGVVLTLQVALLVGAGITAADDELGRPRAFSLTDGVVTSTSSPYPGWFYALPLLVGTALLALAIWVARRRIASTASLPGAGLEDLDAVWRERSAQVVVGLATAAVSFQLGGTALFAGTIIRNTTRNIDAPAGWGAASTVLIVVSLASLLLSVVVLTLAALRAFELPARVAPAGLPARSRA
ncbi:hypothetical protein CZ771_01325 [Actinomycetales bacterium JB111]|nr:hypothetical protein CZ771_01325 [Actinomycetales bacterium JB111]